MSKVELHSRDSKQSLASVNVPMDIKESIVLAPILSATKTVKTILEKPPLPAKSRQQQLGVEFRTPMGEYCAPDGHKLTSLGISPGPSDYEPKMQPIGFQYSILGKHGSLKDVINGPGPTYDVRGINMGFNEGTYSEFNHRPSLVPWPAFQRVSLF